jgi:hypothetical protein
VGCGAELGTAHPWQGEAGVALDGSVKLAAATPCFGVGGGRTDGWARWAKRLNGLAGCWVDWAESQGKFLSDIK